MKIYKIQNKDYYYVEDLKLEPCFIGCSKSNSKFIKNRDLDEDVDYNYFTHDGKRYHVTRKRTRGTYLMISKAWLDRYTQSMTREVEPPLLDIELELKPFVDSSGEEYPVEIRGERSYDGCYFLVSDIASCFGIKDLEKNLPKKTCLQYQEGVHYRYFLVDKRSKVSGQSTVLNTVDCTQTSRMFLTYKGLMRVIFASRSSKAERFADWACDIIFTAHMGTSEQKLKLSADLMGLSKDQVKQYFDTCTAAISGLYLIRLGSVSDLRKTFNIPTSYSDDMNVYKFGRSKNIATRFAQHVRTYAKLKIYGIKLVYYSPIDSDMAHKAESELRDHFIDYDMKLDNDEHTELAIFKEKGKKIKGVFEKTI